VYKWIKLRRFGIAHSYTKQKDVPLSRYVLFIYWLSIYRQQSHYRLYIITRDSSHPSGM